MNWKVRMRSQINGIVILVVYYLLYSLIVMWFAYNLGIHSVSYFTTIILYLLHVEWWNRCTNHSRDPFFIPHNQMQWSIVLLPSSLHWQASYLILQIIYPLISILCNSLRSNRLVSRVMPRRQLTEGYSSYKLSSRLVAH